jgi:hypothetical protein
MYNNKQGVYKVRNPYKVLPPLDNHMKSYKKQNNEIFLRYRSGLELRAMKYADNNKNIIKWGCESFNIKYIKPTDGKIHRYFIDLFIEFTSGDKFIVEIKSSGETVPPKIPKKKTQKSIKNYNNACKTFAINEAKWQSATKFAKENNMKFTIITEKQIS